MQGRLLPHQVTGGTLRLCKQAQARRSAVTGGGVRGSCSGRQGQARPGMQCSVDPGDCWVDAGCARGAGRECSWTHTKCPGELHQRRPQSGGALAGRTQKGDARKHHRPRRRCRKHRISTAPCVAHSAAANCCLLLPPLSLTWQHRRSSAASQCCQCSCSWSEVGRCCVGTVARCVGVAGAGSVPPSPLPPPLCCCPCRCCPCRCCWPCCCWASCCC